MKLGNFLSLDPQYPGKGLRRGGKLDQEVWAEFAYDTAKLKRTAASIGKSVNWLAETRAEYSTVLDEGEFLEVQREAKAVTLKEQRTLKRPDFSSKCFAL